MMDMLIGLGFMAVYTPLVLGYVIYADAVLEKVADGIYDFLFPAPKPEPEYHGDLLAMFGEAVD